MRIVLGFIKFAFLSIGWEAEIVWGECAVKVTDLHEKQWIIRLSEQ